MTETHVFVGRDRECGCIIGMYVDCPACAEGVGRMIEGGLAVDRVTTAEARELGWGHKCEKRRDANPAPGEKER